MAKFGDSEIQARHDLRVELDAAAQAFQSRAEAEARDRWHRRPNPLDLAAGPPQPEKGEG